MLDWRRGLELALWDLYDVTEASQRYHPVYHTTMVTHQISGVIVSRHEFQAGGMFDSPLVRLRIRTGPGQELRTVQARSPAARRILGSPKLVIGSTWHFKKLQLLSTGNFTFVVGSRACKWPMAPVIDFTSDLHPRLCDLEPPHPFPSLPHHSVPSPTHFLYDHPQAQFLYNFSSVAISFPLQLPSKFIYRLPVMYNYESNVSKASCAALQWSSVARLSIDPVQLSAPPEAISSGSQR